MVNRFSWRSSERWTSPHSTKDTVWHTLPPPLRCPSVKLPQNLVKMSPSLWSGNFETKPAHCNRYFTVVNPWPQNADMELIGDFSRCCQWLTSAIGDEALLLALFSKPSVR